MATLAMALAHMATAAMPLLPTPTDMPAQLTMATMPTVDFTSVMPKLSQRLMLTTVVSMATLDMALDLMATAPMLLLPTPTDMPAQLTTDLMLTVDFTSVMLKP